MNQRYTAESGEMRVKRGAAVQAESFGYTENRKSAVEPVGKSLVFSPAKSLF